VFSDTCELQTVTHEGYRYFITFVDDYSRFLTAYPIKKKSDALECFKEFLVQAECQSERKLKVLRTDGGGEYFSSEFTQYLKEARIIHEKTNPHTPQENGVAERVNRTLITMMIAMLESVKSLVGKTAWPYALCHATSIKNVVPHSALPDGTSPYELWTGNKPSVSTI
jgi:transposase InsO family protein